MHIAHVTVHLAVKTTCAAGGGSQEDVAMNTRYSAALLGAGTAAVQDRECLWASQLHVGYMICCRCVYDIIQF